MILGPGFAGAATSQAPGDGPRRRAAPSSCRRPATADVDAELDVEGPMEDDWSGASSSAKAAAERFGMSVEALEQARLRAGISEEEARLWEQGADAMLQDGKLPDNIQEKLREMAGLEGAAPTLEEALDDFKNVGGGAGPEKWLDVPLNDTWHVRLAQVPGAPANFIDMMRTETEATEANLKKYHQGDSLWPAAVILARWLAIDPPVTPLREKTVLELGSGLGLPGITAARLGAARVLLQDVAEPPLHEALQTAVREHVAASISTMRCDWCNLPDRLLNGSEDVRTFYGAPDVILGADIVFDEAAAIDVADVLAELLRTPEQVALLVDPYKRQHRSAFVERCRSRGLTAVEAEIVTWEPDWDNRFESDEEWVCRLLTVRRTA